MGYISLRAKQEAKRSSSKVERKVEKAVTESDLHRKESFQKVDTSLVENKIKTLYIFHKW